ncbi:ParB/RepB/Spo0J family partition protein [Streptomyces sp. NPDC056982]|uniref:ParB/RepB/Spo0J family partition protein n=1 Tax=Streptomyces sp. NPDC056982 TaxID=3345986 RepID=UPI00363D76F7
MSQKDKLGAGRFGGSQTTPVSARRQAVANATGVPTTGAPDSRLKTLPLGQLVPTRFNPRRNFGTPEDLREFGSKLKTKQLAPAVAVTREAYLKLWEGETEAVDTHQYVIANGERRFRASLAVGMETLEVIVDDTIADSRATFLDAVLSENNDREDLDPVEQAIGIQTMVDQLGGKAKVAAHYNKSAGWVTQQLYLLRLAPELQQLVSAGTLPVRETRELVKLPEEQQAEEWERRLRSRSEPKPDPAPAEPETFTAVKALEEPAAGSGSASGASGDAEPTFTAVKPPQAQPTDASSLSPASSVTGETFTAVKNDAADPAASPIAIGPESVPEPRGEQQAAESDVLGEQRVVKRFPYDDGAEAAYFLETRMTEEEFAKMMVKLKAVEEQRAAAAAP